jgi:hypothetical protein
VSVRWCLSVDVLVGHQTESAKGEETAAAIGLAESRSLRLIIFPLLVIDVGLSDNLHTEHAVDAMLLTEARELDGRDDAVRGGSRKTGDSRQILPTVPIAQDGIMLRRNKPFENTVPKKPVKYHTIEISFYDLRSSN